MKAYATVVVAVFATIAVATDNLAARALTVLTVIGASILLGMTLESPDNPRNPR